MAEAARTDHLWLVVAIASSVTTQRAMTLDARVRRRLSAAGGSGDAEGVITVELHRRIPSRPTFLATCSTPPAADLGRAAARGGRGRRHRTAGGHDDGADRRQGRGGGTGILSRSAGRIGADAIGGAGTIGEGGTEVLRREVFDARLRSAMSAWVRTARPRSVSSRGGGSRRRAPRPGALRRRLGSRAKLTAMGRARRARDETVPEYKGSTTLLLAHAAASRARRMARTS